MAKTAYYALFALQHRGQESAGIVVNHDGVFSAYKDKGLVNDVFTSEILEKLGGGGHFTVSGAQLKDCSAEEAKERVRSAIDEYLKEETT